jgi:carboxylesterase type B
VLPQQAPAAFASGDFNKVPVMIGTTQDEGAAFIYLQYDWMSQPVTAEGYEPRSRRRAARRHPMSLPAVRSRITQPPVRRWPRYGPTPGSPVRCCPTRRR